MLRTLYQLQVKEIGDEVGGLLLYKATPTFHLFFFLSLGALILQVEYYTSPLFTSLPQLT